MKMLVIGDSIKVIWDIQKNVEGCFAIFCIFARLKIKMLFIGYPQMTCGHLRQTAFFNVFGPQKMQILVIGHPQITFGAIWDKEMFSGVYLQFLAQQKCKFWSLDTFTVGGIWSKKRLRVFLQLFCIFTKISPRCNIHGDMTFYEL